MPKRRKIGLQTQLRQERLDHADRVRILENRLALAEKEKADLRDANRELNHTMIDGERKAQATLVQAIDELHRSRDDAIVSGILAVINDWKQRPGFEHGVLSLSAAEAVAIEAVLRRRGIVSMSREAYMARPRLGGYY